MSNLHKVLKLKKVCQYLLLTDDSIRYKKSVESKFFIIKVWLKLHGKDNYLRYVTILDTFTMKRTTTMRKFHLNGSSYTLYTEKVIQIMIHFIKKNSIQVAQTLLFTINLTEHVLVWRFHVCYGFILESVVYSLNSALDIGPCNPWCLIISWYLKKHLYSFRHRGIRQTLHS